MAGDSNLNGNYATQQTHQNDNSKAANPSATEPTSTVPVPVAPANDPVEKTPSKEEIGWFFVEQYYKTLCNEPAKLYLYYNKRSQFLSGDEAEKVLVAVGQKAISERIKDLDIQDCKVRVLNVDSQESLKNILVQVIGEISNKAKPHRKFVQTFVLAEQPSGYYVLNDIFRYIAWEEDEYDNAADIEGTSQPTAPKPDTTTLTSTNDVAQQQADVEVVDRKLAETTLHASFGQEDIPNDVKINGHVASDPPALVAQEAPAAAVKEADTLLSTEAGAKFESPRDPDPTPVASSPQPPKATAATAASAAPPQAPAEPPTTKTTAAAPKTWASLVSRAAVPTPPTNGNASAAVPKPAQPKPKIAPMSAKTANVNPEGSAAQMNGNSEWQLADTKQRQNRPHSQSISSGQTNVLGYVKNVTEKVDASLLKARLQTFGELNYFDVSRLKNCAFIEYADVVAYNAAVAANPHEIGGEQIFVEERRPRANAYGGNPAQRGGMRGGRGNNEPFRSNNQGRGGFNKDGGRGGSNNRGRGGGLVPNKARGGTPQAA